MKKIQFQSLVGLGFIALFCLNVIFVIGGIITDKIGFIIVPIILSVVQIILHNSFTRKQLTLQHYPLNARLNYILAKFSPRVLNCLFKNDFLKHSLSSKQYDLVIARANNVTTDIVKSSLMAEYLQFEGVKYSYSTNPSSLRVSDLLVQIGAQCGQPYTLSVLNIDGLTQRAINNDTILALSEGANIQGCAVNTGRNGVSSSLIRGGSDLIWQIAHEDYVFRKDDGSFNEILFRVTATRPYVKMVEVAFPRQEYAVTKRLSSNKTISFLGRLRDLSGGKPIGIRLFNPTKQMAIQVCKLMRETNIYLDFITIDSTVTSTGFDSFNTIQASNDMRFKALADLKKAIDEYALPTKILVSGAIVSEYDILRSIALGASACYCITPMILAAHSGSLLELPDSIRQRMRVANFHRNTISAMAKLMDLCGYSSLMEVKADDFYRRMDFFNTRSLKKIYFDNYHAHHTNSFLGLS